MESGISLYYPGNTVSPPHPGKARRGQMMRPQHTIPFEARVMPLVEKVCAVSKCVWCGYRTDQYFITCVMCRNCQYCGYRDEVDPYRCFICGNHLPEDAQNNIILVNKVIELNDE